MRKRSVTSIVFSALAFLSETVVQVLVIMWLMVGMKYVELQNYTSMASAILQGIVISIGFSAWKFAERPKKALMAIYEEERTVKETEAIRMLIEDIKPAIPGAVTRVYKGKKTKKEKIIHSLN